MPLNAAVGLNGPDMRGAASRRNKSVIRGRSLVTAAASQTVARSNCRIRRPLTILSAVRVPDR